MPPRVAERLRGPGPAPPGSLRRRLRIAVAGALRRGGVPAAVRTFPLHDRPELSFVNAESLVLAQLYWLGELGWEPELMRWWQRLCGESGSIVELGANVGYYTVQGAVAAPGARYVAVEPHPTSLDVCRANLELNRVTSVELVAAAAVADPEVGTVSIQVPAEQLETPTVAFVADGSELPPDMARGARRTIDVPAVDVRSLVAGADLVKLDVEGQEHALLAAARDELLAKRPPIFVEMLPGTPQLRAVLVDLCSAGGYRCYVPVGDDLVEISRDRIATVHLQREYGTNDVIFAARPMAG
jgi:FkbM family methyltransferase